MTALLDARDVHVAYGRVEAVRNVSLTLQHGEIVAVNGPNGAGKTTLLGALMGLMPGRGRMVFDGTDITSLSVEERVERGLCLVPEKHELFAEMSVSDNLALGGYAHRRDRRGIETAMANVYARFPRLTERRAQAAGTLSGGSGRCWPWAAP